MLTSSQGSPALSRGRAIRRAAQLDAYLDLLDGADLSHGILVQPSFLGTDMQQAWRVIPSKYPPIHLFEGLTADPADWELLAELESVVNPPVRQNFGEIVGPRRIDLPPGLLSR